MLSRKERHRQGIGRQPFPPTWWTILRDAVALVRRLPTEDHDELRGHIQILLAEKHFEGAADLAITDAMRLVIAAQAAVLLLHRPTDYYPRLVSVILYPGEYAVQERSRPKTVSSKSSMKRGSASPGRPARWSSLGTRSSKTQKTARRTSSCTSSPISSTPRAGR